MTTLAIRKAHPTDAARLAELSNELGYPVQIEVMARRIERLALRRDHVVLVAEWRDEGICGWVHAAEHDILESGRCCEILGLVVAADRRSAGIGRSLVDSVEKWAAERGLKQVSVRSNVARTESHPFYERLGYVRVKTQHAYRKRICESEEDLSS